MREPPPDRFLSPDGGSGWYAFPPDGHRPEEDEPWKGPRKGSLIRFMSEDTVDVPLWGEDGLIFELEMALVRPGAEGQRPPGQLPPGRGVRTINLGYLGDTLPSDSTPGGWRSADMNSERASGYLGRKKPPPTRSQDLPLAYGLRTPPGRSE